MFSCVRTWPKGLEAGAEVPMTMRLGVTGALDAGELVRDVDLIECGDRFSIRLL